jgi:hypothetical protein
MVTLSGGPLGGQQIDGTDWAVGETRQVEAFAYRREDETVAVFVGVA